MVLTPLGVSSPSCVKKFSNTPAKLWTFGENRFFRTKKKTDVAQVWKESAFAQKIKQSAYFFGLRWASCFFARYMSKITSKKELFSLKFQSWPRAGHWVVAAQGETARSSGSTPSSRPCRTIGWYEGLATPCNSVYKTAGNASVIWHILVVIRHLWWQIVMRKLCEKWKFKLSTRTKEEKSEKKWQIDKNKSRKKSDLTFYKNDWLKNKSRKSRTFCKCDPYLARFSRFYLYISKRKSNRVGRLMWRGSDMIIHTCSSKRLLTK